MKDDSARFAALKLAEIRLLVDDLLRAAAGLERTARPDLGAAIGGEDASAADVPATWLRTRLGLGANEERVLWLVLGFEASVEIRDAIRTLDRGVEDLTLDAVERIVYGEASLEGWKELSADGGLRRHRLIQLENPRAMRHRQIVSLVPRLRGLMLGEASLAAELDDVARLRRVEASPDLVLAPGVMERTSDLVRRAGAYVIATGMDGSGRASMLCKAAHAQGYDVIDVACARIASEQSTAIEQLQIIGREARLLRAAVLLRDCELLAEGLTSRLESILDGCDLPLLATSISRPMCARGKRELVEVKLSPLEAQPCAELWRRAIPMASEHDHAHLAATYPLAPAVIHSVGARIATVPPAELTASVVDQAIAQAVDDRLSGLARRIEVSQTWEDLVLPADQVSMVNELLARVRRRRTVYERWGFGTKLAKGLGVAALFSGPPGTGKTMAASLIAKGLGLQLYQVDLAQMVSKWIGETEKNLARLFDAAESSQAVLLFDEADSLFGKRTEVKSSNDRYANLEVNYLLQRLETFTGICLLTTNHENAIDEAFRRRLSFHIRFPMPDEIERAGLWRALIPPSAPVSPDVDFTKLGRTIELSGGYIRNAVLRAAFVAADQGSSITMKQLWHAAQIECDAAGKLTGRTISSL